MVLKKADENSIIMKSVSVPELLSYHWHWAMCVSYTDPRFSHMFKLTERVRVQQGFHPTQSGPRIDSLPSLALLPLPVQTCTPSKPCWFVWGSATPCAYKAPDTLLRVVFMGIRPLHEEQGEEHVHSHQVFMEPLGKQAASLALETSSVVVSSALC